MLKVPSERDRILDVNGLRVAMRTWGDERSHPVLAIHGWLDNCASFSRIAPHLRKCFIVAPDLAGHGRSGHRRGSYYLWDYALDLAALTQRLGWKKYSILAHSMGTGVASVLNAIDGGVESIVFLDGMGAPFTLGDKGIVVHFKYAHRVLEMARKSRLHGFSEHSTPQFASVADAVRERQKVVGGFLSPESAQLLAERDLIDAGSGYRWLHDPRLALPEPLQLSEQQAGEFVNHISCPLHLFLGVDGLFVGDTFEKKAVHLRQQATVHWHAGGHHFHLENPSNELIRQISAVLTQKTAEKSLSQSIGELQ